MNFSIVHLFVWPYYLLLHLALDLFDNLDYSNVLLHFALDCVATLNYSTVSGLLYSPVFSLGPQFWYSICFQWLLFRVVFAVDAAAFSRRDRTVLYAWWLRTSHCITCLASFFVWLQYMVVYQILLHLAMNMTFYLDGSSFSNAQVYSINNRCSDDADWIVTSCECI